MPPLPSALLTTPGPHPATDMLRQYAAGTLAPADEQRIEAHALDCERCADIIDGLSMSDAPTTDRAVAELRARLQERVRDAAPVPVVSPGRSYQLWPRLAAAAAVAGLAAAGLWGWEHRPPTSEPMLARTETAAPPATASAPPAETAPLLADAPAAAEAAETPTAPAVATAPVASTQVPAARRPARQTIRPIVVADAETSPTADMSTATLSGSAGAPSGISSPAAPAQPDFALNDAAVTEEKAAADKDEKEAADAPSVAAASGRLEIAKKSEAPGKAKAAPEADTRRAAPMPAGPTLAPAAAGGILALREYLRREASNFEPAPSAGRASGSVRLRFVVSETGKLSDIKVTRGMRADYDAEAVRIVCDGPAWQPGIAGGRRAALPVELSVPF